MKYTYSLLSLIFLTNSLFADNWIKYEASSQGYIIPTGACVKHKNGVVDSINLECSELLDSIHIRSLKSSPYSKNELYEVFQYFPNVHHIDISVDSDNDSLIIEQLPAQITSVYIDKIENYSSYIHLGSEYLKRVHFNTENQNIGGYLPDQVEFIKITNAGDMTGGGIETLNFDIDFPSELKTFDCEKTLSNCNEYLPFGLENFGVRLSIVNHEFIMNLLSKNKNLPKFDLLTLYSNNDFEYLSTTAIDHIKRLYIKIPVNHYLGDGFFSFDQLPKNLEYLKISSVLFNVEYWPENLKTIHVDAYTSGVNYRTVQNFLSQLPDYIDTLIITNQSLNIIASISENLQYLHLENIPDLQCLPTFPSNLKVFKGSNLGVNCIPNENFWIKETEEWPLCKDANKICNQSSLYSISGSVYIDVNRNGIIDSEDIKAPDAIVKVGNEYSSSYINGQYYLVVHQLGTYPLELLVPYANIIQITPSQPIALVDEINNNVSIDFLIQMEDKIDLEIIGANTVARPGMQTQTTAFVKNNGILPVNNNTVKILVPSYWTINSVFPSDYFISNDTIIWNQVEISSQNTERFNITFALPATATILGDVYHYEMWVENNDDQNKVNNYYRITDTITGSYDPNDKIVNHTKIDPSVISNMELIYTIRFQNTGTDTAFKVIVVDTIVGLLDPSSFRVIGASHPFEWKFSGKGIATFTFDNILLPDSNVNEPASHGYVTLALRLKENAAEGDQISNRAGIYFDYNEPVITNDAITRIVTITSIAQRNTIPLEIYPNPTKDVLNIQWNQEKLSDLTISDLSGKVILKNKIFGKTSQINTSALPKGMYIIQLQSDSDSASGKLIIQ